jgi:fucose permease
MTTNNGGRRGSLLMILGYVGFVSLGLPDAVIGVAWPSVRDSFRLPQDAAGLVFAASGLGYFVTSFLSGRITHALGVGLMLAASTALVAAAMFGFAFSPLWALFVACAVVHGFGSGAIDAGLNGYAAHHLSARHMNWLHACYCFGAMLGPLLMTAVLTSGGHYSRGYLIVGGVMAALSIVFLVTGPQWGQVSANAETIVSHVGVWQTLRHTAVVLQMGVFFVYSGVEIAVSQWAFTVLTELRGVDAAPAGVAAGVYWGSIGLGRVVFGWIADRVEIDLLLRYCSLAAAAGLGLFALSLGPVVAYAGLTLTGLGLAPIFPSLMTRTPQRLGTALSAHAIGFQVGAAMIGAAIVPAALGVVAGEIGLQAIPMGATMMAALLWFLHEGLIRRPDAGHLCDPGARD